MYPGVFQRQDVLGITEKEQKVAENIEGVWHARSAPRISETGVFSNFFQGEI